MPYTPIPYSNENYDRYGQNWVESNYPAHKEARLAHEAEEARKVAEVAAMEDVAKTEAEARARAEAQVKYLREMSTAKLLPGESHQEAMQRRAQSGYELDILQSQLANRQATQQNRTLPRAMGQSHAEPTGGQYNPTRGYTTTTYGSNADRSLGRNLNDYLVGQISTPLAESPYSPPGQSVEQRIGNEILTNSIGNDMPYLENANDMLQTAARPFSREDLQHYMIPVESMLKDNRERAQEYYNNVILPSIEGKFTRLGQGMGYGAQEQHATLTAKHLRDLNASENEMRHKAQMSAYDMYRGDRSNMIDAARLLSGFGAQRKASALAEASQFMGHGASARDIENQKFQYNQNELRSRENQPFNRAIAARQVIPSETPTQNVEHIPPTQNPAINSSGYGQVLAAHALPVLGNMIRGAFSGGGNNNGGSSNAISNYRSNGNNRNDPFSQGGSLRGLFGSDQ